MTSLLFFEESLPWLCLSLSPYYRFCYIFTAWPRYFFLGPLLRLSAHTHTHTNTVIEALLIFWRVSHVIDLGERSRSLFNINAWQPILTLKPLIQKVSNPYLPAYHLVLVLIVLISIGGFFGWILQCTPKSSGFLLAPIAKKLFPTWLLLLSQTIDLNLVRRGPPLITFTL